MHPLNRRAATTLQMNIGLTCNLACLHCHVEAPPYRFGNHVEPALEQAALDRWRARGRRADGDSDTPSRKHDGNDLPRVLLAELDGVGDLRVSEEHSSTRTIAGRSGSKTTEKENEHVARADSM